MAIGPFLERLDEFDEVQGYHLNRIVDFINAFTDYSGSFNLVTSTGGSLPSTQFGTLPIKFSSTSPTTNSFVVSIPSKFKHITFKGQARSNIAATSADMWMQFNQDGVANYVWQQLFGNNNAASSTQVIVATATPFIARIAGATADVNMPTSFTIDINNYSGTTFIKQAFGTSQSWESLTAAGEFILNRAVRWNQTSAITSVSFGLSGGSSFITGSTFDGYLWP